MLMFNSIRILLLTFIMSSNVHSSLVDLYAQYQYPLELANHGLIVQFPYVHAVIERLHLQGDRFFFGLINMVYLSQSMDKILKVLLTVEKRFATQSIDSEIEHQKNILYLDKWWLEKDFFD